MANDAELSINPMKPILRLPPFDSGKYIPLGELLFAPPSTIVDAPAFRQNSVTPIE